MNNNNQWFLEFSKQTKIKLTASLSKLVSLDEVDDIVQEAYLKLFEISQQKNIENPQALLFRIARNITISRLRHENVVRASVRSVYDIDQDRLNQLSNEEKIRQEDERRLLDEAIANLPNACRQVFLLRKVQQKSHKEIATLLNVSTKTVENHITKAMKLCREYVMRDIKMRATKMANSRQDTDKVA
ncbi:sigma-70 family RNA polymerase sigma factor [Thalassotalea mangrovi]|uniref:Sigma-70 family RNA polymerase sigma factor n=1 Tax=Thalassotalea mangrovi TaxID=2572245 RepID=A0A4V5NW65_9GAMM|nr:sigma-70 family RNA polymerase sigma factor [Thalassotalea mangrovi]TKB45595.1 sigma-70 family RNA polymerase sigma factor [Thalassotalea mangrovi]